MRKAMLSCLILAAMIFFGGCAPTPHAPEAALSPEPVVERLDAAQRDISDEITADDAVVPDYLPQGKGEAALEKQQRQAIISIGGIPYITIDYYETGGREDPQFPEAGKMQIQSVQGKLSLAMRLNAHIGVILTGEPDAREDLIKVANSFSYRQGPPAAP